MTATVYYYIIWLNVPLNQQTMHIFIIYYLYEKYISILYLFHFNISVLWPYFWGMGCLQKENRIAQKVKLAHTAHQERHALMRRGVKILLSHVPRSLLCFCFHTICSISWGFTSWKFSRSCNNFVTPLEKWGVNEKGPMSPSVQFCF